MNVVRVLFGGVLLLGMLLGAAPRTHAQDGPGTTGAQVLQLPAGSRAAAFSGAYAGGSGDADVLFYNPAGLASLSAGASLAYQKHVEDITLGSVAGAFRVGPFTVGAGVAYLDAGEIQVVEPDPEFGGQRGRTTDEVVSAYETAARLSVAAPLAQGRFHVGAGAGLISSELAGVSRSAPLFDMGVQAVFSSLVVGAALRNVGGSLTGDDAEDARLPTEARVGGTYELTRAGGLGVQIAADVVSLVREGTTGIAAGVEAGLMPDAARRVSAVARIGYETANAGDDGLGPLTLGAGIALGNLAVDYAYRHYDFFGDVHRIGIRWARGR